MPITMCPKKGKNGLKFSEANSKKGSLGKIYGNELLRKLEFS